MLKTECDLALWYGIVSEKDKNVEYKLYQVFSLAKQTKNGYIMVHVVSHLSINIDPDLSVQK